MAIIQIKRGSSNDWQTANPILALAELGLETDTNQIKAGDGTTPWSQLAYLSESVNRVESVNGKEGVVVLTSGDIYGLENVDNTSDADKPVSTATQAAIDAIDAASIGLDQVDNTSDLDKPVSTATETAYKAADEVLGTFLMGEIAKKADYGDATTNADNISTNAGNIQNNSNAISGLTTRVSTLEIAQSSIDVGSPAADAAGFPGQTACDADYLYICVANDTWKRVALTTY